MKMKKTLEETKRKLTMSVMQRRQEQKTTRKTKYEARGQT
jgi:hypothetical protein